MIGGILAIAGPWLLRAGVRSPALQSFIVAAGIGLAALVALGLAAAWDNNRLAKADAAGYERAAGECREQALAAEVGQLRNELAAAAASQTLDRKLIAELGGTAARLKRENASYAVQLQKAKAGCPAPDSAAAHDRRLLGK